LSPTRNGRPFNRQGFMKLRNLLALLLLAFAPAVLAADPPPAAPASGDAPKGEVAKFEPLQKILMPYECWSVVGEGYQAAIGLASNAKGEVFFNDPPDHKTLKIGLDGKV